MPASYFAPAFQIEVDGSGLAAEVSSNVTQVRVTQELDRFDGFSFTLANPYPKMPWTHDKKASKLFAEGSSVKISLGYVGAVEPLLTGEITGVSPSFPASGTPTVAVQGYNRLHRLKGSNHRTFPEMSDQQIVEQIAKEVDLTAEVEDTGPKHPYVVQHHQTDLDFLQQRARLIGFELLVEDKTLKFRRAPEGADKAFTLAWAPVREDLRAAGDVLPLESFEPTLNTLQQVSEVKVLGYDPKTKQEIVGKAGAGDEESEMGDETGPEVAAKALGKRERVLSGVPVASQEEAEQIARAVYNRLASGFLTGSGVTIGCPGLAPGKVAELVGLGRFSGTYYVVKVSHSLGAGGYKTSFDVRRNAV